MPAELAYHVADLGSYVVGAFFLSAFLVALSAAWRRS
jgi:hypothetical protein